jgi:hypothetical protein
MEDKTGSTGEGSFSMERGSLTTESGSFNMDSGSSAIDRGSLNNRRFMIERSAAIDKGGYLARGNCRNR